MHSDFYPKRTTSRANGLDGKEYLSFDDVLIYPRKGIVASRNLVDTTTVLAGIELGIPILSAPMQTVTEWPMANAMRKAGGLGVLHRFMDLRKFIGQTAMMEPPLALAVGAHPGEENKAIYGSILFLDVAHAHSDVVLEFLRYLRKRFPEKMIVAGSVATRQGARDLIEAGADALRVGIGAGHACSTRIQTGCGVPQLSAIANCAEVASEYGKDVIADGGIRTSGDIVKALAAGASCVMLGRLLAGADEAPLRGEYYGQASEKSAASNGTYIEGVYGKVEDTGPVAATLDRLMEGVRSGISYAGSNSIKSLQETAQFIRVTSASAIESSPRIEYKGSV